MRVRYEMVDSQRGARRRVSWLIISYPISASRIIVKYYVHMGEGAGRTLRQVAHVTQDKVSHLISRFQEVGRRTVV